MSKNLIDMDRVKRIQDIDYSSDEAREEILNIIAQVWRHFFPNPVPARLSGFSEKNVVQNIFLKTCYKLLISLG